MRLALFHRRLTLLMALAALTAFAAGAGLPAAAVVATGAALVVGLVYQPSEELSDRIERIVLVVAAGLMLWALYQVLVVTEDVVAPVVALLLVLLSGEALRSLSADNDARLYTLSFALLVAATAYLPGLLFGVAFVAFVVIATLAIMIGHLRRQAEAHDVARVPIDRTFLTATGALSLVTLGMAVLVFLAFPRLPRNLFNTGIQAQGASMAGFSDQVSLGAHGARIYPNPDVVLRVELDGAAAAGVPPRVSDLYWRGRSYDHFDGLRWTRSRVPRSRPPGWWYERWSDGARQQRIYGGGLDARVLFGLHPVLDVDAHSGIRPVMDEVGDMTYVGGAAPIYTVVSAAGPPPAERLRSAVPGPRIRPQDGPAQSLDDQLRLIARAYYLQLPSLSPRIAALADSLTQGAPTQYDRVLAVQRWLRTQFRYTLELPATAEQATLEHFLFERRAGHCEYFSTALAVLLRSVGIPARNVNGFLGGEWNEFGRYIAVTQNEAHSWVEVWFDELGWVQFDATPAGAARALARDDPFFGSFRFVFDGLQHRWNKWVVDYNLTKQLELFGRVSDLFSRDGRTPAETAAGRRDGELSPVRAGLFLGLAVLLMAAVYWLLRRVRRGPARADSRLYLGLRRAYERRGYGAGDRPGRSLTPLEWLGLLYRQDAPGRSDARALVELYLERRFGPAADGSGELERMRSLLRGARRELREAR